MRRRTNWTMAAVLALGAAVSATDPAAGVPLPAVPVLPSILPGDDVEPRLPVRRPRPAAERTRVYVGMWTSHLRDLERGVDTNSLIGLAVRGFYAATFINSYGDRALAAGIQRSFTPPRDAELTAAIGYRAGLVTGYDERFLGIGDKLPAVPFVQLVGSVDRGRLGLELAWAGVVTSLMFNVRL